MTIDMEYYRKINGLYSTTDKKDFLQKQAIKSVNKTNDSMLSTFEILINSNYAEDIIADGISAKCIFDYSKTTQDTKTELASYTKEMWIEVGFVNVGSIIKHTDKISLIENTYLVISKQEDLDGYDVCYIQKTNNTILFYPPSNENSVLNEIPCIIGDVSIGNSETKYITTVDNELPLTLPNNEITRQIKVNDIYKLGLSNYQIISVADDISIPGLLVFKLSYSEIEQILPVFTVNILNGDILSTDITTSVQLNVQTLKDGVVLSPTLPVTYSSSDELVATISSSGLVTPLTTGNVVINCKLTNDLLVSDSIIVNVIEVPVDNFTYLITPPDTEIKSGVTKIYTAHKYNNGIEVVGAVFDFAIIAGSTSSSAYVFSVINDVSCSLKCNQYTYYVTLRATDRLDDTKYVDKVIKLRSII